MIYLDALETQKIYSDLLVLINEQYDNPEVSRQW